MVFPMEAPPNPLEAMILSMLCPWERHLTQISSLHPSVKGVPGYRQ